MILENFPVAPLGKPIGVLLTQRTTNFFVRRTFAIVCYMTWRFLRIKFALSWKLFKIWSFSLCSVHFILIHIGGERLHSIFGQRLLSILWCWSFTLPLKLCELIFSRQITVPDGGTAESLTICCLFYILLLKHTKITFVWGFLR